MKIDNQIYSKMAHAWWDDSECGSLATIRFLGNKTRFEYFKGILKTRNESDGEEKILLDVGCGGGFLTEEFAKIGLKVTGIDPSNETIEIAKQHAYNGKLDITYLCGYGENLPFESDNYDYISCCDVFEHVDDLEKVLKEISRVLKTGGILFYDTINRTVISKLLIKITQEWEKTSFLEPNVHLWGMFIKPKELFAIMKKYKLDNKEIKGISPGRNFIGHYLNLKKSKKGKISYEELGKRLKIHISNNILSSYIGYAVKEK